VSSVAEEFLVLGQKAESVSNQSVSVSAKKVRVNQCLCQEVQKNGSKNAHFGTFLLKTRSFLQKKHKKAQKNTHFYPHF
jgi:hypothetical protein